MFSKMLVNPEVKGTVVSSVLQDTSCTGDRPKDHDSLYLEIEQTNVFCKILYPSGSYPCQIDCLLE